MTKVQIVEELRSKWGVSVYLKDGGNFATWVVQRTFDGLTPKQMLIQMLEFCRAFPEMRSEFLAALRIEQERRLGRIVKDISRVYESAIESYYIVEMISLSSLAPKEVLGVGSCMHAYNHFARIHGGDSPPSTLSVNALADLIKADRMVGGRCETLLDHGRINSAYLAYNVKQYILKEPSEPRSNFLEHSQIRHTTPDELLRDYAVHLADNRYDFEE